MDTVGRQQPLERGPVVALRIGLAVGVTGNDLRRIVGREWADGLTGRFP